MPAYVFTKGQQTVNVTKSGGYVSSILYGGKVSARSIDEKEAIKQAAACLKKLGYQDMRSTYYATDSNICTVNFAYCRDGIFYYTDLIKVGVSLRDGNVVSLEARAISPTTTGGMCPPLPYRKRQPPPKSVPIWR